MEVADRGTNPTVEKCGFNDGQSSGIYVHSGAAGTFIECEARNNKGWGLLIADSGTNPTVTKCQIQNNLKSGIWVQESASGIFRNNHLTGNARAWSIDETCRVVREGNEPNQ